jgi:hypothetical protein
MDCQSRTSSTYLENKRLRTFCGSVTVCGLQRGAYLVQAMVFNAKSETEVSMAAAAPAPALQDSQDIYVSDIDPAMTLRDWTPLRALSGGW